MTDQSYLDDLYFIDEHVFNCPFCNRRHVNYSIAQPFEFQWTNRKDYYVYFARCKSCKKTSMHLSERKFLVLPDPESANVPWPCRHKFCFLPDEEDDRKNLDSNFFYSVPTSYFVLGIIKVT